MPILITLEEKKKFFLPSTQAVPVEDDRLWVVMDVSPQKMGNLVGGNPGMSTVELGIIQLTHRILEWNAMGEDGAVLEINTTNVGYLSQDDYSFLWSQVKAGNPLTDDQKKTSSPTTLTSTEVVNPQ